MPKENSTIDEDLYNGLQQARKKKPRYFALIAKGTDVVGLIVQKKVINDGVAQKLKSECKGTLVIQGVCCGEGNELKFEVEGKEPSILPKKIKDYIDEKTDLTIKPYWAVVPQLSAVEDEDGPPADTTTVSGTSPVAPPGPTNQQPPTANKPPKAPPQPPVDVKALQARLKKLLERSKELVGKNPELREKLQPLTKPAADLVLKGSADAAEALDKLERALDAVKGGRQGASQLQQQWEAEHAKIERRYVEVLRENPPDSSKIRAVMAYATEQADSGAYDKALVALKRLEPLLNAAPEASGPRQSAPGRAQQMDEQPKAAKGKTAESQGAAAEIAAVLKRQSGVMQGALDLAGEIEKASADLQQMGAALAGNLEDEGDEGEEDEGGEEMTAEARAQIAAVLKRQSGVMQGALDLAGDIEKASADLQQMGAALVGSLEDDGDEGEEDEGGEEMTAEARAQIAAVLKRQSGVMQGALDLAGDIEKASADLQQMGAALVGSLEDDGDEGEEDEGGEELTAEARAQIAAVLKRQSGVMQGALDLAGDIEKASADLQQMGAALAGSLEDEGDEGDEDEEEKEAAANLLERVLDVQAQAASLPEPAKKELQKQVRQLQVALAGGDARSIAADVDALENELARASAAARGSEASKASGARVSFRRSVFEWRDAQADSRKQLDQFVAAFLADREVQADPRFAQISVVASEIAKQMPMFGNDLEDALNAIDDAADDAARAKARTEAQKVLADYSKTLDGAEGLHELQALADDEFGGISFVSELQLAIDKLEAQLASAG